MGSLCGKPSKEDHPTAFSTPGRTISSTQPPPPSSAPGNARAPIPARAGKTQAHKVGGPGRTVGGSGTVSRTTDESGIGGGDVDTTAVSVSAAATAVIEDPRAAAARAAEERASRAQQPKGKLGETLAAQRKRTQGATLAQASREERGYRGADENAEVRRWE